MLSCRISNQSTYLFDAKGNQSSLTTFNFILVVNPPYCTDCLRQIDVVFKEKKLRVGLILLNEGSFNRIYAPGLEKFYMQKYTSLKKVTFCQTRVFKKYLLTDSSQYNLRKTPFIIQRLNNKDTVFNYNKLFKHSNLLDSLIHEITD